MPRGFSMFSHKWGFNKANNAGLIPFLKWRWPRIKINHAGYVENVVKVQKVFRLLLLLLFFGFWGGGVVEEMMVSLDLGR